MFPARGMEIAGFFVYVGLATFSSAAGISGGFAYLSFMIMFKFTVSGAVILSNLQIFVSSFIRILFGLDKPHPLKVPYGTLYHFQIISLMIPMCSLGSIMATMVSKIIPDLYIVILYAILLIIVLLYNLKKLRLMIQRETRVMPLQTPIPTPTPEESPVETEPKEKKIPHL